MPDDRFIHRRSGHGTKPNMLNDLEHRVWVQYMLSADDFGVMRATHHPLQNDNDHLANRTAKRIQCCLDVIIKVGLIRRFEHQGKPYVYQHDWQTWQKVSYPRTTTLPCPPHDAIAQCDGLTRQLFSLHPGGAGRTRKECSENVSEKVLEDLSLTRAHAPAKRLTANANGLGLTANGQPLDVAFRSFQEAYPPARRKGGLLTEQAYVTQAARAGGPDVLMMALENHKASEQWQTPSLVPGMNTWLNEERWRQTLPAAGAVMATSKSNEPEWVSRAKAAQRAARP